LKKISPLLIIVILSSLLIAGIAALFSVTGISMLFSKRAIQVASMALSLEIGKLVLTSIVYRYWNILSKLLKAYMIIAIVVLMTITSAGIFGYLSDAYQRTKGNYDIVNKEIQLIENKKKLLNEEYNRIETRLNTLIQNRTLIENRLDNLYKNKSTADAKRVEQSIKTQDTQIDILNKNLSIISDSISSSETKIIEKQSKNISGELGPLVYISTAFNTNMDSVVKMFILILIFVFDPLALSLLISANIIYNKSVSTSEWTEIFETKKPDKIERDENLIENSVTENFKIEDKNNISKLNVTENIPHEIPKANKSPIHRAWKSSNWRED